MHNTTIQINNKILIDVFILQKLVSFLFLNILVRVGKSYFAPDGTTIKYWPQVKAQGEKSPARDMVYYTIVRCVNLKRSD